jgi:hypothetical protein
MVLCFTLEFVVTPLDNIVFSLPNYLVMHSGDPFCFGDTMIGRPFNFIEHPVYVVPRPYFIMFCFEKLLD